MSPVAAAVAMASVCSDSRCTDGVTWCAGCNGHGVLNPKGRRYRVSHRGELPTWAVPHADCAGTGIRACGCVLLSDVDLAAVSGLQHAS